MAAIENGGFRGASDKVYLSRIGSRSRYIKSMPAA